MKTNISEKIILEALKSKPRNADDINKIKRLILRTNKSDHIPTTAELLKAYHNLTAKKRVKLSPELEHILTKRAVRTLSGVSIITVLTKPFACPGECIYCPNEKIMPKSYISDEPAAARALMLSFDPYEQVKRRFMALQANGHPTDKIELIVKGGTWNAYPANYQYWFILRCFEAANLSLRAERSKTVKCGVNVVKFSSQEITSSSSTPHNDITSLKKALAKAQKKNEKARHRIVGLTLETRPDYINEENIWIMRELGCTRLEIGVQTTDDKILTAIKRGHGREETIEATKILKRYGFKVDYHLMPQLPGSTPAKDLRMMKEIFSDDNFRPDMIKIYPCTVVENSELYEWLKQGKYKPYANKKLIDTIKQFKASIPRYVRISRLIRDIPSHHIKAGNKITNLRQIILKEMERDGQKCKCLRCREIGHNTSTNFETGDSKKNITKLFVDKYKSSGGTEYFLSFEDKKRNHVFAFCRLRLDQMGYFPAFIRELHVYGQTLAIGKKNKKASQHKGLGKQLLQKAEEICAEKNITTLAIISGVGVRKYYQALGYKPAQTYMIKKI